jgi:hypothetical protein
LIKKKPSTESVKGFIIDALLFSLSHKHTFHNFEKPATTATSEVVCGK